MPAAGETFLFTYDAPALHYFERDHAAFEALVESMALEPRASFRR